jgi:endonuclease III
MIDTYKRAITIFKKNYVLVPLEVFHDDPYKTLISTLMSARTKDELTLEVATRLFQKAPTIQKLAKLETATIEKLIYPVGFYRTKAKHIKKLAEIIVSEFGGTIPQTREELMSLPGVGRKTANLVLNRAFGIPAIAVDIHVHRISNLMGWVESKTPEETEKQLTALVPVTYWKDINRLLVSIGRQFYSHKKLNEFLDSHKLLKSSNSNSK